MLIRPIAEAISLADTIIILSKRPSIIKNIYNINLTNKTTPLHNRNCPEFNDYYQKIWQEFEHEI